MNRAIDDSVKLEYLEWLLTPPSERDPKTKQEIADQLDVSLRTLYYWENSDFFQSKLNEVKTKWGAMFHGDILGRLIDIVREGSDRDAVSASRVLLQHLIVETPKEKGDRMDSEIREKIKAYLDAEGYKVIDAE